MVNVGKYTIHSQHLGMTYTCCGLLGILILSFRLSSCQNDMHSSLRYDRGPMLFRLGQRVVKGGVFEDDVSWWMIEAVERFNHIIYVLGVALLSVTVTTRIIMFIENWDPNLNIHVPLLLGWDHITNCVQCPSLCQECTDIFQEVYSY